MLFFALNNMQCGDSSSGEEFVVPTVYVDNRASNDLGTGAFLWINGTYSSTCRHRSGDWSARISGAGGMTHEELSVVRNDTRCALTLTEIVANDTYLSSPPITFDVRYAKHGSSFATLPLGGSTNPVAFYGNAKLTSMVFGPFVGITVVVSDEQNETDGTTDTTYTDVSSDVSGLSVESPDYEVEFSSVVLQVDINNRVQVALGDVGLVVGENLGEHYVISSNTAMATSFGEVDSEYQAAGNESELGETISMDEFSIEGAYCPVVRNLIISHSVAGVRAYEVITITFNGPS